MNKYYIPINKGNYSMDTPEREYRFELIRGLNWETAYKKYREDWFSYPKLKIISEYPLLVDIELSSLCNLSCKMCYTISQEFKEKVNATRMNFELYKKIIDEIAGKVPAIRLSLRGESTLHKNFIECIAYAKKSGIQEISTLTHGGKLNIDYFSKMVEAGIDWITISVDGIGDTYNAIRNPLKFETVLSNIRKINEYKLKNNLLKPAIKIQGIWPAIEKDREEYYKIFSECSDLVAFNPLIDYLNNDISIEYIDNFSCPQQYQRLVIGADGLVMKCSNDEDGQDLIGDVNKNSIYEIWHGSKMEEVRELHNKKNGFIENKVCQKCYLPRKTLEDPSDVNGRTFTVKNYTFRIQIVGK